MSTEGGNIFELEVSNCLLSMKYHGMPCSPVRHRIHLFDYLIWERGRKKLYWQAECCIFPRIFLPKELHVVARMPLSNL